MNLNNSLKNNLLVADTGPLLALIKLNLLPVLGRLFEHILITETVLSECLAKPHLQDAKAVQAAIDAGQLHVVKNPFPIRTALLGLDEGEQTALEMALQLNAQILIDERKGRMVAKNHHLKVIGVLGVLLLAKNKGFLLEIKPLLNLLLESDYFLSEAVVKRVLVLACE